jgi:hypothetical protein
MFLWVVALLTFLPHVGAWMLGVLNKMPSQDAVTWNGMA